MEFQQLRNFICVAECKSISQAARKLLISQPALSRSIRALEEDMGVVLITRTGQGIELTPQGLTLLERARDLLSMESHIKQELQSDTEKTHTIHLVCRCIERFLMDILSQYRSCVPHANFCILQNDDIALQNHQYDLIVSGALADETGYTRTRLLTERFLCAIPADHPFAGNQTLSLQDFSSFPQIQFGGHRQVQWFIKDQLYNYGLDLPVSTICDDVRTGCNLVTAGFGALLIPEYALDPNMLTRVKLLPIDGLDISREVYLYHRSKRPLPEHIKSFSTFLIRYFENASL